jgi:hypothetical protein
MVTACQRFTVPTKTAKYKFNALGECDLFALCWQINSEDQGFAQGCTLNLTLFNKDQYCEFQNFADNWCLLVVVGRL